MTLVLTPQYRESVFREFHDNLFGAHMGVDKTLSRIKRFYYWPHMAKDITRWITACASCVARNTPHAKTVVPLAPVPIPKPFTKFACDFMGPLPKTENANKYICVFIEYATKYVEVFATPNQTAETAARLFVEGIVCRHGAPDILLSDRGPCFNSELLKGICNFTNTDKIFSTAYSPASNGLVERFNRTLTNMLSHYVNKKQNDWDVFLPAVTFAYNCSSQSSTGESPFFLVYGRDPRLPADLLFREDQQGSTNLTKYKTELVTRLTSAWESAKTWNDSAQVTQKYYYDRKVHDIRPNLSVGDRVHVYTPVVKKGLVKKLTKQWYGPYRALQITDTCVKVVPVSEPRAKHRWVHLNRCKVSKVPEFGHISLPQKEETPIVEAEDELSPQTLDSSGKGNPEPTTSSSASLMHERQKSPRGEETSTAQARRLNERLTRKGTEAISPTKKLRVTRTKKRREKGNPATPSTPPAQGEPSAEQPNGKDSGATSPSPQTPDRATTKEKPNKKPPACPYWLRSRKSIK